ncbi:MAG: hypothetical protein AB7F32_05920 [Victivallaceae bacterium]
MQKSILTLILGLGLAGAAVAAELNVAPAAWNVRPGWEVTADKVKFAPEIKNAFILPKEKLEPGQMSFETDITITGKNAPDGIWKVAGIIVGRDSRNFIQLGFVESPDKEGARRFIELKQMREGKWGSVEGLDGKEFRSNVAVENNQVYKLKLTLGKDGATGTVADSTGKVIADLKMPFLASGEAVNSGAPMLRAAGYTGEFANLKAETK